MTITVSTISNNQTFGTWLATTNILANLMSQNTVTSDSSNGGSITTGNSFVNGHFGAEYVYVANTLIGGNVSSNGVLKLQANIAFVNSSANIITITANSTSTAVNINPSGNVTIGGNTTILNASNLVFSSANILFSNSPINGDLNIANTITLSGNLIFNSAIIIANNGFGSNGQILYSNGTGMYWDTIRANNGIVSNSFGVFVNANNGIVANTTGVFVKANNGIVSNTSGVFVNANTGIVVNTFGVFVNSAYISTISSNSALYANASITNTFTVGTASYFVANGNLGIGNSAPAYKLRVQGDISLSGGIHANGSLGTNGQILTSNGSVAYWANVVVSGGTVTSVASGSGLTGGPITTSGTLSVLANNGITSNTTGLYVTPGTGIIVNATGVHVNSTYISSVNSNTATYSNGSFTNTFTVGTASYFVANGNLGIGNSTPVYKLRVQGDISVSGGIHANGSLGSANQALFSNGTGVYWATISGTTLTANNTDTQTFYLPMSNTTSGSWSNGVVSTTKLYFVPSTGTLNATEFNSLSDISYKENIDTIQDALSLIKNIDGISFNWKDTGKKSLGVSAQQLEKILPQIVTNNLNTKTVNYNGLIAVLLQAIKELQVKVELLNNDINKNK